MGIISKYFLSDPDNQKEKLPGKYVDVFIVSEEQHLVDYRLCHLLSKEINSNVYWYTSGNISVICVLEKYVIAAIKAGRKIIIENFDSISAEFICENTRKQVFDDYSIISTFPANCADTLDDWCKEIDPELIVRTNPEGQKCILTKNFYVLRSKIKLLKLDFLFQLH